MNTTGTYNQINYLLHTPSWTNGIKQPLIIFLHGIGERGDDLTTLRNVEKIGVPFLTKTDDICEKKAVGDVNYFVLAPQLRTRYGSWPSSVVKEMIDFAKANLEIDPTRIYLCGLSLGGGGVWTALQDEEVAKDIAAAVVCCGTNMLKSADVIVKHKIPIYIYHAVNDTTVDVKASENAYTLLREAKANVRYVRYADGGHSIWNRVFSQIHKAYKLSNGTMWINSPTPYEWFANYSKAPIDPIVPTP